MSDSPLIPKPIVVFVRPQAEGNIGALSRAMANFSCAELRLVGEGVEKPIDADHPFAKIDWALAKKGEAVLQAAQWYPSLADALHGTDLALGTSGKEIEFENSYARPIISAQQGYSLVRETFASATSDHQKQFRWALVMGPEHDGLNSQELGCCHSLIHIETSVECPSMNIAIAAACLLYHAQEFFRNDLQKGTSSLHADQFLSRQSVGPEAFPAEHLSDATLAKFEDKEAFVAYLIRALSLTSFFKYPDHEAVRARLRRIFQGMRLPRGELLFLFEMIYQLKCWGQQKFEERNFLSSGSSAEKP